MTYQKLSLPFSAITLAVLLITGTGPTLAQGISGAFLFTGTISCVEVNDPATFDSAFRPTAARSSIPTPILLDTGSSMTTAQAARIR